MKGFRRAARRLAALSGTPHRVPLIASASAGVTNAFQATNIQVKYWTLH